MWKWRNKHKIKKESRREGKKKKRKVLLLLASKPLLVIPRGPVVVEQWSNMQIVALWQSVCDRHHSDLMKNVSIAQQKVSTVQWLSEFKQRNCIMQTYRWWAKQKFCAHDRFVWEKKQVTVNHKKKYHAHRHAGMRCSHKACWMQTGHSVEKLWEYQLIRGY